MWHAHPRGAQRMASLNSRFVPSYEMATLYRVASAATVQCMNPHQSGRIMAAENYAPCFNFGEKERRWRRRPTLHSQRAAAGVLFEVPNNCAAVAAAAAGKPHF